MATLNLKGIAQLASDMAAAVQAKATALVDFSTGSVLRAFVEANAAVLVWLQGLVLQVLAAMRLSTAQGSDVDTFLADWNLTRLSSTLTAGSIQFSRYTATTAAVIPIGARVQTSSGSQAYQVVADATNPAYSLSAGGYLLPAGVISVLVPVQALVAGANANAAAGTINVLTTAISGVDSVTNPLKFIGGVNAESDTAAKARFPIFIQGLSRGNIYGAQTAILGLGVGIEYQIVEGYSYSGAVQPGFFYVVVDDGTGFPPASLLAAVTTALNAIARPLSIQFGVFPTAVIFADVSLLLAIAPGYVRSTVAAQVSALITANIQALVLGAGLQPGTIDGWARSVLGVAGVTGLLLNGASGDASAIVGTPRNTINPRTITVS